LHITAAGDAVYTRGFSASDGVSPNSAVYASDAGGIENFARATLKTRGSTRTGVFT